MTAVHAAPPAPPSNAHRPRPGPRSLYGAIEGFNTWHPTQTLQVWWPKTAMESVRKHAAIPFVLQLLVEGAEYVRVLPVPASAPSADTTRLGLRARTEVRTARRRAYLGACSHGGPRGFRRRHSLLC